MLIPGAGHLARPQSLRRCIIFADAFAYPMAHRANGAALGVACGMHRCSDGRACGASPALAWIVRASSRRRRRRWRA